MFEHMPMTNTFPPAHAAADIWFLNGPNANLYGLDANQTYGQDSFPTLKARCEAKAAALRLTLNFVQSDWKASSWTGSRTREARQGVIINAAGLTYSSVPILDASAVLPGQNHRGAHE